MRKFSNLNKLCLITFNLTYLVTWKTLKSIWIDHNDTNGFRDIRFVGSGYSNGNINSTQAHINFENVFSCQESFFFPRNSLKSQMTGFSTPFTYHSFWILWFFSWSFTFFVAFCLDRIKAGKWQKSHTVNYINPMLLMILDDVSSIKTSINRFHSAHSDGSERPKNMVFHSDCNNFQTFRNHNLSFNLVLLLAIILLWFLFSIHKITARNQFSFAKEKTCIHFESQKRK